MIKQTNYVRNFGCEAEEWGRAVGGGRLLVDS